MYKTITVFFYEQWNINQNPWWIHVNVWQNQSSIVKSKKKNSDIEESNREVSKAAKKFSPNLGTTKFY